MKVFNFALLLFISNTVFAGAYNDGQEFYKRLTNKLARHYIYIDGVDEKYDMMSDIRRRLCSKLSDAAGVDYDTYDEDNDHCYDHYADWKLSDVYEDQGKVTGILIDAYFVYAPIHKDYLGNDTSPAPVAYECQVTLSPEYKSAIKIVDFKLQIKNELNWENVNWSSNALSCKRK